MIAVSSISYCRSLQLLGTIETYPVWGLDSGYDFALAQGLAASDECYVADNLPYRYLEFAVGAITWAYLTKYQPELPDYSNIDQ